MPTITFQITGEFITEQARSFAYLENDWPRGWDLLVNNIHGMNETIASQILRGEKRLEGINSNIELIDETPEGQEAVQDKIYENWGHVYREGRDHWAPYAYVTSWGRPDVPTERTIDMINPKYSMMDRQQGGGTFYSKFNRCRCLHYADNPLTDIVEYIEIPKDIDHHLAGTCVAVLFKKVDIPPTWVRPLTYTDGGHVASFIAALHNGTWMPERGYFQTYGDGEPFMPRSVIDMSPDDIVTSESENLNDYFDDEVVTGWKPNIEETKGFDTAGVMARQMAMMFPGMDSESIDGTLDSIFGKDYEDKVEPSEPDSKYGWIIRNGDFYKCKYHGHQNLARKIFRDVENMKEDDIPANAEEAGEKAGWVKLFKMMMDKKPTAYMAPGRHPTAKQTYTLEQWASHMKIPLEDVMDGL